MSLTGAKPREPGQLQRYSWCKHWLLQITMCFCANLNVLMTDPHLKGLFWALKGMAVGGLRLMKLVCQREGSASGKADTRHARDFHISRFSDAAKL